MGSKGGSAPAPTYSPPPTPEIDYAAMMAPMLMMMEMNMEMMRNMEPQEIELPESELANYTPIDWARQEEQMAKLAQGIIAGETAGRYGRRDTIHTTLLSAEEEEDEDLLK